MSVLAPVLYTLYINDALATPGIHLALFADDTCMYARETSASRFEQSQVWSHCCGFMVSALEHKALWREDSAISFSRRRRMPEDDIQLCGRKVPFVSNVKYLGVTFDRRMTWRLHIEKTAAKALGMYIMTYSIFKSKYLNANIKLIMYRALIRSIMTYTCPTWEFASDTHLKELQRPQNSVLRAIGNLGRHTPVRHLHLAFQFPYVFDYITKLCRRQAEVILNHENPMY
jgi:hypothetical protein